MLYQFDTNIENTFR